MTDRQRYFSHIRASVGLFIVWLMGTHIVYPELAIGLKQLHRHDRLEIAIVYLSLNLLTVAIIPLLLSHSKGLIKLALYVLLSIASFVCVAHMLITSEGLNFQSWSTLLNNNDPVTIKSFLLNYSFHFFSASILTILYCLAHRFTEKSINFKWKRILIWAAFSLSLFAAYKAVSYTNGVKDSLHPIHKTLSTLLYYRANPLYTAGRSSPPPLANFDQQERPKHVFLVIDESITYSAFANTVDRLIHKDLALTRDLKLYGEYVSGAVCSDYANALLLVGLQPSMLPDTGQYALRAPTLYQYAQKAGYSTAWVNSYSANLAPYGFINETTLQSIDTLINRRDIPSSTRPYNIDKQLLTQAMEWSNLQKSSFVIINKVGCHFPYDLYTPPNQNASENDDYVACVDFTTSVYFDEIRAMLDSNSVVLYTSDHGQHQGEDPSISLTHCARENVHWSMASIPAASFTFDPIQRVALDSLFDVHSKTHYGLFNTTISLLGYKVNDKDLNQDSTARIFSSGDIFGRSPCYLHTFNPTERK